MSGAQGVSLSGGCRAQSFLPDGVRVTRYVLGAPSSVTVDALKTGEIPATSARWIPAARLALRLPLLLRRGDRWLAYDVVVEG